MIADTFVKRFRGLMWKKRLNEGEGLLIKPCNQVHTFNMRFAIDVVYLSKRNKVVYIETLKPNRAGKLIKEAFYVLEVMAGTTESLELSIGDEIEFDGSE